MISISPFSAETLRPLTRLALSTAASSPVTSPNPQVGCVIVDDAATVLAQGRHLGAGSPHAETAALKSAQEAGVDLAGKTAIVTLEPCSRQGRTPPCADALIAAGRAPKSQSPSRSAEHTSELQSRGHLVCRLV